MDARLSGRQIRRFVLAGRRCRTVRAACGHRLGYQPVSSDPAIRRIGNPIVCENQLPGNPDTEWDVPAPATPNIQGFATDISVDQGQTVSFKIKSTTAYHLDIYRMGYYGGLGARKVATDSAVGHHVPQTSRPA